MTYHTRIAPSPTGNLHLGTARTAYHNYLAARASGGTFSVRIDDTDKVRSKQEYTDNILSSLEWLGLEYDRIEYQSKRAGLYESRADAIADKCEPYIRGVSPLVLDGVVLLRSDGSATYHFACVVDDVDMGVNYIIRGTDHIANVPKQEKIYQALSQVPPKYEHVGLIHRGGKKLSKREGAASILELKEAGYHPGAVLNFLLRMGWGPTVDDKSASIITKERAVSLFLSGGKMRAAAANYDQAKLDWLNKKYKGMKHGGG